MVLVLGSAAATTTRRRWRSAATRRAIGCFARRDRRARRFGVVGTRADADAVPLHGAQARLGAQAAPAPSKTWLEVHLFCGIVGPVLITFHTSFKFNGIVSAAYWSMVTVVLSGFIGRYLYVRIPRSIRGNELTRAELDARADELKDELAASVDIAGGARADRRVRAGGRAARARALVVDLLFGEMRLRAAAARARARARPCRPVRTTCATRLVTLAAERADAAAPHRVPAADEDAVRALARVPPAARVPAARHRGRARGA